MRIQIIIGIAIALSILLGLSVGYNSVLSEVSGLSSQQSVAPGDPQDPSRQGLPSNRLTGTNEVPSATTGTGSTPTAEVNATEYTEQVSPDIEARSDPLASPTETRKPALASTSTPSTINREPSYSANQIATPTDKIPARESVAETVPPSITVAVGVKEWEFQPSTITVPAGARVTIVFDNQDVGASHNFAIFTDTSLRTRIFTGKIIVGRDQATETFTAPSQPGVYVTGCCVPSPHRMGTFIVE